MIEGEVEKTSEEVVELLNRDHGQNSTGFNYEENIVELKILQSIITLFEGKEDACYSVVAYLSGFKIEEERNIACDLLNSLREFGAIFCEAEGVLYDGKIDINTDYNTQTGLIFRLSNKSYGIFLYIAKKLCDEAEMQAASYKYSIESVEQTISEFDRQIAGIISKESSMKEAEENVKRLESSINEKTAEWLADFERKKQELNNFSEKALKLTEEKIEQSLNEKGKVKMFLEQEFNAALMREGKIGTFLENIQKDMIQYMGIFIAIFALLNLNLSNLKPWNIRKFVAINLSLVASMTTLAAILAFILHRPKENNGKQDIKFIVLAILAIILWFVLIYLMF